MEDLQSVSTEELEAARDQWDRELTVMPAWLERKRPDIRESLERFLRDILAELSHRKRSPK